MPIVKVREFESTKFIHLEQKHLEDVQSLKNEAEDMKHRDNLDSLPQVNHLSLTFILSSFSFCIIAIITVILQRNNFKNLAVWMKENENPEDAVQLQEIHSIYPKIPTAPQNEDVLS